MEFELELELAGNSVKSLINNHEGNKEECRGKISSDILTALKICIDEGARKFGLSFKSLLGKTKSIRIDISDIVMDTLKNKKGTRIGLLVTKGYEENIYLEGNCENPIFNSILTKDMTVGIKEEVSDGGKILLRPQEEEVKDKVRYLLEYGSGILAVSFKNADLDAANERLAKKLIEADYPRHYLGAVPILISADFCQERDPLTRTKICLLNAYTWFNLEGFLTRAEAFLKQNGYKYNLLVAQEDGESVRIQYVTPHKTCTSDIVRFLGN